MYLLKIYKRSLNASSTFGSADNLTVERVRQEICSAVENEIQAQATEYEISDDEYHTIASSAWSR